MKICLCCSSSNAAQESKVKTNRERMWELSSSILQMDEQWTAKSITTTSAAARLMEITRGLIRAVKRCWKEKAVEDLRWYFNSLAEIMGKGHEEEAVMPQEISSSGLISALLLCLSSSSCRHWSNVVS